MNESLVTESWISHIAAFSGSGDGDAFYFNNNITGNNNNNGSGSGSSSIIGVGGGSAEADALTQQQQQQQWRASLQRALPLALAAASPGCRLAVEASGAGFRVGGMCVLRRSQSVSVCGEAGEGTPASGGATAGGGGAIDTAAAAAVVHAAGEGGGGGGAMMMMGGVGSPFGFEFGGGGGSHVCCCGGGGSSWPACVCAGYSDDDDDSDDSSDVDGINGGDDAHHHRHHHIQHVGSNAAASGGAEEGRRYSGAQTATAPAAAPRGRRAGSSSARGRHRRQRRDRAAEECRCPYPTRRVILSGDAALIAALKRPYGERRWLLLEAAEATLPPQMHHAVWWLTRVAAGRAAVPVLRPLHFAASGLRESIDLAPGSALSLVPLALVLASVSLRGAASDLLVSVPSLLATLVIGLQSLSLVQCAEEMSWGSISDMIQAVAPPAGPAPDADTGARHFQETQAQTRLLRQHRGGGGASSSKEEEEEQQQQQGGEGGERGSPAPPSSSSPSSSPPDTPPAPHPAAAAAVTTAAHSLTHLALPPELEERQRERRRHGRLRALRLSGPGVYTIEWLGERYAAGLACVDLSDCSLLTNADVLAHATQLRRLSLAGTAVHRLDFLRDGPGAALETLDLSRCAHLHDLSPLRRLTGLERLSLARTSITGVDWVLAEAAAGDGSDDNDGDDDAGGAPPAALVNLAFLDLSHCRQLRDLRPLARLPALHTLLVADAAAVRLDWLAACPALRVLRCTTLELPPPRADAEGERRGGGGGGGGAAHGDNAHGSGSGPGPGPASLLQLRRAGHAWRALDVSNSRTIDRLDWVAACGRLTSLDARQCSQLTDLSAARHLRRLRRADLRGCAVRSLEWVAGCPRLEVLLLGEGFPRAALAPVGQLRRLRRLDVSLNRTADFSWLRCSAAGDGGGEDEEGAAGAAAAGDTPGGCADTLEELCLARCPGVTDLPGLRGAPRLRCLQLSACGLTTLAWLAGRTLQALDLSLCKRVGDWAPLGTLRVARLSLAHTEVPGLEEWMTPAAAAALTSLTLTGCARVCDLRPLRGAAGLRALCLSGTGVTTLGPLGGGGGGAAGEGEEEGEGEAPAGPPLPELRVLRVSHCALLGDLSAVGRLPRLRELEATHLPLPTSAAAWLPGPACAAAATLESVNVSECARLRDLSALRHARRLTHVNAARCPLASAAWALELPRLASANFSECARLSDPQTLAALSAAAGSGGRLRFVSLPRSLRDSSAATPHHVSSPTTEREEGMDGAAAGATAARRRATADGHGSAQTCVVC